MKLAKFGLDDGWHCDRHEDTLSNLQYAEYQSKDLAIRLPLDLLHHSTPHSFFQSSVKNLPNPGPFLSTTFHIFARSNLLSYCITLLC